MHYSKISWRRVLRKNLGKILFICILGLTILVGALIPNNKDAEPSVVDDTPSNTSGAVIVVSPVYPSPVAMGGGNQGQSENIVNDFI